MLDFFAAVLLITGGIACLIFWIVAFAAIVIEVNDNIRERKAREGAGEDPETHSPE